MATKVLIVHGFEADKDSHWFGWLDEQLTGQGVSVWRETLPNTTRPVLSDWVEVLRSEMEDGCILVGHSLGVPALLKTIETQGMQVSKFFSVAGFIRPLAVDFADKINGFVGGGFDFEKIRSCIDQAFVLDSLDDPYVSSSEAYFLMENLDAQRLTFTDRGHLGGPDFPELLEMIVQG